ncbi:MAG: hypothetical protein AAF682_21260 [Planctomycetota bacterium]
MRFLFRWLVKDPEGPAFVGSAVAGTLIWALVCLYAGRTEAWESTLFWRAGYPALAGVVAGLAYTYRHRPWRWPLIACGTQAACALTIEPQGWVLPFAWTQFGLLALPLVGLALAAAAVGRMVCHAPAAREDLPEPPADAVDPPEGVADAVVS